MTNASEADKANCRVELNWGVERQRLPKRGPSLFGQGKVDRASAAEANLGAMTIAGTHVNPAKRAGNNRL